MTSQKLQNVLRIIGDNLIQNQIPYSLIGAFALSAYGLPRFTANIDLLTEGRFWPLISPIMEKLGYTCYKKTKSFAQFDSEFGALGAIDFMFVNTPGGTEILERSVPIKDVLIGDHPVVQPTDYVVLKLMAIANNPGRCARDEGDIIAVLKSYRENLVPEEFDPLDRDRILFYARRFGLEMKTEKYFRQVFSNGGQGGRFRL